MNKVATSPTPSRDAGFDGPSIDEMLRSGSFHERLAAARAKREKALAASAEAPEQLVSGQKPWERPEYMRGEPQGGQRKRRPRDGGRPAGAVAKGFPILTEARPAAETGGPAEAGAQAGEAQAGIVPAPAAAPTTGRLRLLQVAGGAACGIAVGIAVGYWFADGAVPVTGATSVPAAPQAALAVGTAAPQALQETPVPGTARIALPGADGVPAMPEPPQLSKVTYLSATLPHIALGGPVEPAAAIAPRLADAGPAVQDGEVPVPVSLSAPQPGRGGLLAPPAPESDLGFAGLSATGPVSFAAPLGQLPDVEASLPALPAAPDAIGYPVALLLPDAVTLPDMPGDAPLAGQDVPLPVARPVAAPRRDLTLIVRAPSGLSDEAIGAATEALTAGGFAAAGAEPVDFKISETNVRYFSPADKESAAAVARTLDARLRDFTDYSPRPPEGTIEVWLAGQGDAPARAATAPAKAHARAEAPSAVDILKNRLIRQLRAGTLN